MSADGPEPGSSREGRSPMPPQGSAAAGERIRVTTAALDPEALDRLIDAPASGARVLFVGAVRETSRGRAVVSVRFEAYIPMVERVLHDIVREAMARFALITAAVHHRVGELVVGELAVVVAVGAPHRAGAFDGCRYIIDELKTRAPIWKHERYTDGEGWVSPTP